MTDHARDPITDEIVNWNREEKQMFTVIINTPGYLSEQDDPPVFDEYADAVAYLNEEIADHLEQLNDGAAAVGDPLPAGHIEWGLASSGNYAAAMLYDHNKMHDLGTSYAVEAIEQEDAS